MNGPEHNLTKRELQMLMLLSNGYTKEDIGKMTGVATTTVRFHLGRIYRKLEVNSGIAAVARALREGIIE